MKQKVICSLNKLKKVLPAAQVTFFAMRVIGNEQFLKVGPGIVGHGINIVIFLNCDLLELEIRDISNLIVTMFLSVSYDYVFKSCSSYSTVVS